ncbi:acyl-CoA dehydrogenase domain-containing protein [Anopheles sinensis]|uniref:Acyl-CoA dehydrogenase domain-containing protein n=1 Tax=Anopheles sinensis TaxID=74873 RepID=A0A084W4D7_ANOSI|nr:acyl-CoA dehydrogenase domain-containing protein [Anopheles sinensis]
MDRPLFCVSQPASPLSKGTPPSLTTSRAPFLPSLGCLLVNYDDDASRGSLVPKIVGGRRWDLCNNCVSDMAYRRTPTRFEECGVVVLLLLK